MTLPENLIAHCHLNQAFSLTKIKNKINVAYYINTDLLEKGASVYFNIYFIAVSR